MNIKHFNPRRDESFSGSSSDFIFGFHSIIEAIKAGKTIEKVLLRKGLTGDLYKELKNLLNASGVSIQFVPDEKLDRVTRKNHQGAIAFISPIEYHPLDQVIPKLFEEGLNPLILILDCITDVRNFGAICRSAVCAGVHAVVIPTKGAAQINADAVKTSAGALNVLTVCKEASLLAACKYLKNSGLQVVGATEKASEVYFKSDFTAPTAIVLGSEETGISDELLKVSDALVRIPITGSIASLNVSVAASVVLFEAVRQRGGY